MGYLTIKNFNNNKIHISHSKQYYSLGYNLDYIKLSSISIFIKDITIVEDNGYYITINDKQSIQQMRDLDSFLSKNIKNYKSLLHSNLEGEHYIYLKKNNYLENYIKSMKDNNIIINIIKLKKTASHTFPIVYVL